MIYGPEHLALQQTVSKFIAREINPHVDAWERDGAFPAHDLFKKLGSMSLLGITKPARYGGSDLDYRFATAFHETLGEIACGGVPMAIGVQSDMATPALAKHGSHELCEEFLAPSISGEKVACLGVSETGAGSDVASIETRARSDGDDYVIDGGKMWTTNGAQADWMCLLANTGEGAIHANKSLICVPMDSKGLSISKKFDKLGMRSSDTVQVFFEGVRVPKRYRIGEEGRGFGYQMEQFQEERLFGAASNLRGLDIVIDETIDYARQRKAFGRSILDNQVVHFRLAELKTEVECLRSLVYRAVEAYVGGADVLQLASMAKLKAGRLVREVSDACLQYYGGMGYMTESKVSRFYRDTRLTSIGGGADEVMLGIIAKTMGTLPAAPKKSREPVASANEATRRGIERVDIIHTR